MAGGMDGGNTKDVRGPDLRLVELGVGKPRWRKQRWELESVFTL